MPRFRSMRTELAGLLAPSPRTYRGLLYAANRFPAITESWQPGNERVVVLAPHSDDEVLGCGGAIALHRRAGAPVTVVVLTDGSAGSSRLRGLTGEDLRQGRQQLTEVRRAETRAAMAELDVDDVAFLDAVDGRLAEDTTVARSLAPVMERARPQIVYLPSFLEQHPDHRAANQILLDVSEGLAARFAVHAYEVWTPHFPNCLVTIDIVIHLKRAALAHYRSQLREADFQHGILGLNAYRAMTQPVPGRRYAEAYCALPYDEYAALYRKFRDGSHG
ncbi:MAG: PIG-L deacetylase family protein [Dehalococcoidia bacterium]